MSIDAKTITAVSEFLKENDDFLIVCHLNPDGDSIGAMAGLYLGLCSIHKKVQMYCSDPVPAMYQMVPASDKVFVSEEKPSFKHLITVDCAAVDRLGRGGCFFEAAETVINIDHHASNPGYGTITMIDPVAGATGEIVFELLKHMEILITKEIADALMIAISTDTGHFMHSNTSAKTLAIAGELVEAGCCIHQISSDLYKHRPLRKTLLIAKALQSLELHCGSKIALIKLRKEDLLECGANSSDCEGLIDYATEIEGVQVALLIREEPDSQIKVSFRSNSQVNVADIAAAFSGGGHPRAAGASINASFCDAYTQISEAVAAEFKEPWMES